MKRALLIVDATKTANPCPTCGRGRAWVGDLLQCEAGHTTGYSCAAASRSMAAMGREFRIAHHGKSIRTCASTGPRGRKAVRYVG